MGNIAVIGAGKLAYSFCAALTKANYKINYVLSRNETSAKLLAKKFDIKKYTDDFRKLKDIGVFFLCIPDNAIQNTALIIAQIKIKFKESVFVHFSGSQDISLLNPLKEKGAYTASFHIMQSFPSKRIVSIKNCYCAIETVDEKAKTFLVKLAEKLELNSFFIKSEDKVYYHLAGVYISNFLVGNYYHAYRLFQESKVEDVDFIKLMEPILKATLNNIKKNGIANALSGPVDRGDIKTIKKHLSSINNSSEPKNYENNVMQNYILQSLGLLDTVMEKYGELDNRHLEVKKILEGQLKIICEEMKKP